MPTVKINPPKISGNNPNDKIRQLEDYLYQLTEQLNWAFNAIDKESQTRGDKNG